MTQEQIKAEAEQKYPQSMWDKLYKPMGGNHL